MRLVQFLCMLTINDRIQIIYERICLLERSRSNKMVVWQPVDLRICLLSLQFFFSFYLTELECLSLAQSLPSPSSTSFMPLASLPGDRETLRVQSPFQPQHSYRFLRRITRGTFLINERGAGIHFLSISCFLKRLQT